MKQRLKFAALSTLIGVVLYFVASEIYAALVIQFRGEGPHGYGTLIYAVAPIMFVPAGALAGVVLGCALKVGSYRRLLAILPLGIVAMTLYLEIR